MSLFALHLVLASAMVLLGLAGLFVRPAWVGGFLFLVTGLGVWFLTDLILLGIPLDQGRDLLLDETFFLAWLVLFILIRLWLRRAAPSGGMASRIRDLWQQVETLSLRWGDPDYDDGFVEERQFNYSLKAAGEWAEKRKRRMAELSDEDDPQ